MAQGNQPTIQAQIIAQLSQIESKLANPDKSNHGPALARAFIWDTIGSYAKKQSDNAWNELEKNVIDIDKAGTDPGEMQLARTPTFTVTCKISEPVKRFNDDALAEWANKKYKIPKPLMKQAIQDAKLPTKGTKTLKVIENVKL